MIERTEVDGVTALVAPTTGPTRAGLTFRVGRADETLARSGITHLIEHLALYHLNMSDYHFNGSTGAITTDFHLEGAEDDITGYLAAVCEALADLPFERLAMEREVLRTEWANRSSSVLAPFAVWRYGSRGHGLTSYPEWGLPMLGPDELRAWTARYFTRENAVLWVAGRVPAGLRLPLPSGVRQSVPEVTSALPVTPAFFRGEGRSVAIESIVDRSAAGSMFAAVLDRELFRTLRQESGLSYTAAASYESRGDGKASLIGLADALPGKQDAVLGAFIDVLATLRVGRIDPADLTAVVSRGLDALARPDAEAQRLPAAAVNELTGHEHRDIELRREDLRAVTLPQLHEVAQSIMETALLMAPAGTAGAAWAGFAPAPTRSVDEVEGHLYRRRDRADAAMIIGSAGVTSRDPGGLSTVRFEACSAYLAWPDGGRQLIGYDAIGVVVEPTMLDLDRDALARLDGLVPAGLRVDMPPRDPRAIPKLRRKPPPAPVAAPTAPPGGLRGLARRLRGRSARPR